MLGSCSKSYVHILACLEELTARMSTTALQICWRHCGNVPWRDAKTTPMIKFTIRDAGIRAVLPLVMAPLWRERPYVPDD